MATFALVLFEPAVQHIGVHAVLPSQGRNGRAWNLAGGNQFCFELCRIGSVGESLCASRNLCFLGHGVHDLLRAHDLARLPPKAQDGLTGRLRSGYGDLCAIAVAGVLQRRASYCDEGV